MALATTELNPGLGGSKVLHDSLVTAEGAAAPADAVAQMLKLGHGPLGDFNSVTHEDGLPVTMTAAKLYSFRFENVGRDGDAITKSAGDLRFHGMGARTAVANVNAPQAGDTLFDLTNGVRPIRNIANNAWVSLHT